MNTPQRSSQHSGFTMIELVIVITLSSIVLACLTMFINLPIRAYQVQNGRAELQDNADSVTRMLNADVRAALPNSVRTWTDGITTTIEMLAVADSARYYRSAGPYSTGNPAQDLLIGPAMQDNSFSTTGGFANLGIAPGLPFNSNRYYLVVANAGVASADAYARANVSTPLNTAITIADAGGGSYLVTAATPAFKFTLDSPARKVYLVSGAIKYLCDSSTGKLYRYSGYVFSAFPDQLSTDAQLMAANATRTLVAENLSSCIATQSSDNGARGGLLSVDFVLTKILDDNPSTVHVLQEIAVENLS